MKKVLALILTVMVMCSLFACGSGEEADTTTAPMSAVAQTEVETTAEVTTEAPTEEVTEKATEAPAQKPTQAVQVETKAPQDAVDNTPTVANVTGYWKHSQYGEHHTITITSQQGNTLNMTIQSVRGNAAQISDAFVTAKLTVTPNGAVGTFSYEDSFMNTGTGQITINSANSITLAINMTYNAGGGWGIMAASGDYIRG